MIDEGDAHATILANALSECLNAVALLAAPCLWRRFREATPPEQRRHVIVGPLSSFLAVVPLLDDPNLSGPKDQVRRVAAVAAELQRELFGWTAEDAPSPAVAKLARHPFAAFGMAEPPGGWDAFEGPNAG